MNFTVSYALLRNIRNNIVPCIKRQFYCTTSTSAATKANFDEEDVKSSALQSENDSGDQSTVKNASSLSEYRYIFPEFLPHPVFEFRNKIREKLERADMLKRRKVIYVPEFYVGSILAVTTTDPHAPGKKKRFVGICILRTYFGLRATFTLRNFVDNQGVEIMYDLYNPTIISIELLRLEKRLDDELLYLRDAPPEYSTFPFDMEPEFLPEGQPVPLNPLKVKLKPPPWGTKWEQRHMNGIESTDAVWTKSKWRAERIATPWEKYDVMKQYRKLIPEEDQVEIWQDVHAHKDEFPSRAQVRKRTLQKAPRKVPK